MVKLTQQFVREAFDYDPETGVLTRRRLDRRWFRRDQDWRDYNRRWAGLEVGGVTSSKYVQVTILGEQALYVHRVIWLWMTGDWPDEIDHRDRDRRNNKWSNLREVSHTENGRNQRMRKNNTTGVTGVYRTKQRKFWASIGSSRAGNFKYLGRFDTLGEAGEARRMAQEQYGYSPGHGT